MFSDFVIYADESGDHSLSKVDPDYPVFVLSLCVFRKNSYVARVVPSIQNLKFRWFGHDAVILHERDIRKQSGPFHILGAPEVRKLFMEELSGTLRSAPMRVIASVIDKRRLRDEYLFQDNPYHIALQFCLERAYRLIRAAGQADKITYCVFEKRGLKEDKDLELEFRRITAGSNSYGAPLRALEMLLVDKKANCSGLQIADLTARPIGLKIVRPAQVNRAFELILPKMRLAGSRSSATALHVLP